MTANKPPHKDPHKQEDKSSFKDKFKDSFESFKKSEKVEEFYNYATANTRDTIAYILLIAGIILMFFEPTYGGTLIGAIFGLYFGHEVVKVVTNYQHFIDQQGLVRSLILGGTLVGLFIAAPMIFVGAAVAIGIRMFLVTDK